MSSSPAAPPAPPPRRNANVSSAPSSRAPSPPPPGWKGKLKARGAVWGKVAVEKSTQWSDSLGGKVNSVAEKRFGTEAFWPTTGDFPKEMDKAARILRAFTVDGVLQEDKKANKKVIRKIPPAIIEKAKGLAIFTSMRSGIAPFGGAGGAGLVVAKLPDGTWSAPSSISPNNLSAGFLLGIDVYDCVLVIRSQKALDSFGTHKVTLGTEIAIAAGPYGAGAAVEAGKDGAPVFSYVRSRGMYAGVEVVGQVFVERFEENGAMYHWPGVKAKDILTGKVRVPVEAAQLQQALKDAESGRAQRMKGSELDIVVDADSIELFDGEVLKLPPTPDMTDGHEQESDPETERVSHHSLLYTGDEKHPFRRSLPPSITPVGPPPPLPPRSARRPREVSSASHYSDAEDGTGSQPGPSELPPAYDTEGMLIALTDEKSTSVPGSAAPFPALDDNEPMSESERREWAQFMEEHEAEQRRLAQDTHEDPVDPVALDGPERPEGGVDHEEGVDEQKV